jgi:hypothetical protein
MNIKDSTFNFKFNDLKINALHVEHILGYNEGDDRELVNSLIEEIFNESCEFCNIKAEYRIYNNIDFIDSDNSLEINKINFRIKKIVFGQLKKSDSIAVFLCTAGEEIGKRSRKEMAEGDPLKGYIYDIFGSMVADAAADLMQEELEMSVISSGKKITNRYSPGYCGWDVAEQHKLFRLVPDNFCGIKLTGSALMDPVKSISGLIGIGEKVKYNSYTCNLCDMKDCTYRNLKQEVS